MLDSISLAAIAQEARNCFLEEDAPEYLAILRKGILELKELLNPDNPQKNLSELYQELGRAAHSIKGGAGMAEMPKVSQLSHKIEDIFEALQGNKITDLQTTFDLLDLAIEELDNLIVSEVNGTLNNEITSDLLVVLDNFITSLNLNNPPELIDIGLPDDSFIKTALTEDLSACIERVTEIINNPDLATTKNITNNLNILIQECQLLGQALNCKWLVEIGDAIDILKEINKDNIQEFSQLAIAEIEYQRKQFLEGNSETKIEYSKTFQKLLQIEEVKEIKPPEKKLLPILKNHRNLRIPLDKITKLSDIVGELLIFYERLNLYENQIKSATLKLNKRTKLLSPLKEQIESIYDQLTITENNKLPINNNNNISEFDSLEFDEYTQVHTSLQSLTELITQVQEVREDFDLVNREFQETLIDMRKSLYILDTELRQVRLVPFINLAGSFINPLEKLNKTYNKSVELVIENKETLIDQNIIESLRTPFNHIIRNAFDHGIESQKNRKKSGKSLVGKIKLSTQLDGNNIIVIITDDGGGIDIKKVYKKAISLGLFSANTKFNELTKEQILATIFSPGFSTTTKVNDLSGRGMGMDIVKDEIEKLRGTIEVNTEIGKGTEFKLKIPMSLNIISLLLVKISTQILAIPSENILRIIRLSDYKIEQNQLTWENKKISVYNLSQILPYNQNISVNISSPSVGLIIKIATEKIIIAVDAVIDEKPLVTKSFDDTVDIPPYLGGCTVLGNGKIIPILAPNYLKPLLNNQNTTKNVSNVFTPRDTLSIMIIDDSVTVRRSLNRLLTQVGYEVTQCRDGKEAWNTLQNNNLNLDLAICDLEMPEFDGYKVLQLIRVSEKWQNLPVIILTSRDNDLHRQKALELGANAYITKPFNAINIIETIKQLT
ncbi:MAG: response regulator [Cyanobacteria bacterium]|nr:response regulator [Cyanobacteria bacterium CG_2015-16_32_12]NCO79438.1 response regulator [Cyanobacteria bacterium CG_2015-22_32_23]NCQ03664.1 response regulator [Cyanobacteria bacterium CG_2015-09_32_10]NCQ41451.1 response regulator [Cyanobacteria bacterium CG_2015-04_32_10]NCS85830.1 response regulator [Cyanobacteria bacterium CG_2015-02_32_10]